MISDTLLRGKPPRALALTLEIPKRPNCCVAVAVNGLSGSR